MKRTMIWLLACMLLAALLPVTAAADTAVVGMVARLTGESDQPLAGIRLSLWLPNRPEPVAAATTDDNGYAVFRAQAGSYFVGGDITPLRDAGFGAGLSGDGKLFYLSGLIRLGEFGQTVVLKIEENQYLDVACLGDRRLPRLTIKQADTGIHVVTPHLGGQAARLFLPMRRTYQISHEQFLHPLSVYAGPGTQAIINLF